MGLWDTLSIQLADPFRIGLLVALLATIRNTSQHTGILLPLLAGMVFVAALIPVSTGQGQFWTYFACGLLSNAIILCLLLSLYLAFRRLSGANRP